VSDSLSFGDRFWFAWVCFFKVLFDGRFAKRAFSASTEPPTSTVPSTPPTPPPALSAAPSTPPASNTSALALLSLLQRDGRLIDFLEQDIAPCSDADVASAARVVHDGCRKALHARGTITPLRTEDEGAKVTLTRAFSAAENRLVGDVRGEPPYTGTLRHRGWRITGFSLPTAVADHDGTILAPAEIDL
jgi:hypothetical protein